MDQTDKKAYMPPEVIMVRIDFGDRIIASGCGLEAGLIVTETCMAGGVRGT